MSSVEVNITAQRKVEFFEPSKKKRELEIMRVLVADDSGIMRKIIIRSLNSVGVSDIVEAADGQEAINAYNSNDIDLILTDWNMPNKSGLDVVTEIRGQGSTVPIIMVTTEAQKGQVIAAIQAGVSDYLTKPFEADDLRAKLDKFVTA
jgi:two-component system chemotaxis response regulator CheY